VFKFKEERRTQKIQPVSISTFFAFLS